MLGITAGLADLYVPLRYVAVNSFESWEGSRGQEEEAFDPSVAVAQAVSLDQDLLKWFGEQAPGRPRMIQGNPGSGKSTVVRVLASTLLASARRAVVVPLLRLRFPLNDQDASLRAALGHYLREEAKFPSTLWTWRRKLTGCF